MEGFHHAILYRSTTVRGFTLPTGNGQFEQEDLFFERLGIDDARELVRKAYERPREEARQVLLVRTNFITHEAQNSLLKVFEEPPESTGFVLVIPSDFNLLPTLNSRLSDQTKTITEEESHSHDVFMDFLQQDHKGRLELIDGAVKKKDLDWQRGVKQGLVHYLHGTPEDSGSLQKLEFVARSLLTRGASNKMLLEHAALILPTRL